MGLVLYRAGLIFNGVEELLDDAPGVLLTVFKGPAAKALLGSLIQGALIKARGTSVFLQLLGLPIEIRPSTGGVIARPLSIVILLQAKKGQPHSVNCMDWPR